MSITTPLTSSVGLSSKKDATPGTHACQYDIAIIGGGFSGTMALIQCLTQAKSPRHIALFSRSNLARGVAYSTRDAHHLLNVPAHNMSAFPDKPNHFVEWLQTRAETRHYTPSDFVPRCLYGDYIASLFAAATMQQKHQVTVIEKEVTAIDKDGQITTSEQPFSAHKILLALGNEAAALPTTNTHISPWDLQDHPLPSDDQTIVIMGAGLTGVDAFLTLRARGFKGRIILASRSGRIPQPHLKNPQKYQWNEPFPTRLSNLLHAIRGHVAQHEHWQDVVDGLRPHLQTLWQAQPIKSRHQFLTRQFGLWNIHRHRMAPQIWEQLQSDPNLHIIATHRQKVPTAALTVHCIGQTYRTQSLRNPLIQQLLRDGLIHTHATGFGLKAEGFKVGERLYAIGSLLIGERLETTAVPELRTQAAQLAALL